MKRRGWNAVVTPQLSASGEDKHVNANVVNYVMPALVGAAPSVATALITLAASRGGLTDASAATKGTTQR